ncbi:hypothetical protein [Streptomyces sp. NPDC127038]|uniref:hypothetical protein n=1 Tax=Streptomyces sp. NPDC127038 TaxID=3347114 RepID=UPI00366882FC
MIFIVSMTVVFAAAFVACLVILRRRGSTGEHGALERGAAAQGLAQGLSTANAKSQNTGSWT